MEKYGFLRDTSYEMTYVKRANESRKEVLGLESLSDKMPICDEMPYEQQVKDLVDILRDRENMERLLTFMIKHVMKRTSQNYMM